MLATVKVDALSKFGFKSGDEYINWSKLLKDEDKVNVVPGRTLQMDLYVAESGKRYVNKVLNEVQSADVPTLVKKVAKSVTVLPMPKAVSEALDKPMLRADWDAKDRRISRQGVIQAAVQAVSSYVTEENHLQVAELLATKMLEFVGK